MYICTIKMKQLTHKFKDMKTTLKNKVIAQLIKWGNNEKEVNEMVNLHFDSASKNFENVKSIAMYIRTVY